MEMPKKQNMKEDKINLCGSHDNVDPKILGLKDKLKIKHQNSIITENKIRIDENMLIEKIDIKYGNVGTFNKVVNKENETLRREYFKCISYCFLCVCLAFILGLVIGVFLVNTMSRIETVKSPFILSQNITKNVNINSEKTSLKTDNRNVSKKLNFVTVSFTGDHFALAKENHKSHDKDIYPKGMSEDMKDILKDNKKGKEHKVERKILKANYSPSDNTVIFDNIYWGPLIENSFPEGYGSDSASIWEKYVGQSEIIKMEIGCGRMQNRLVTFNDGIQACVRYRQNTDQIQGEIFSFYVGRLLNLTNLAPSVVKIVDLNDKLWKSVAAEIGNAKWNNNRPVVLTQYISSLESATIPEIFKPSNRHLNKFDIFKITIKENDTESKIINEKSKKHEDVKKDIAFFNHVDMNLNRKIIDLLVELAQWSDLIIFDYLTANLDRIVNNLFNFQWNANIMDGPAHNLAKKIDSGLLMFLDNESGLLHGYRLLKKYNIYHSLMLENLCVFRKSTVMALKQVYESKAVGGKLSDYYHEKNDAVIRDILPPLPEKNAKILQERIGNVLSQVEKCEIDFSKR